MMATNKWGDEIEESKINRWGDRIEFDLGESPAAATAVAEPPAKSFDTSLSADDETQFAGWKSKYAPQDSGDDYDLRGAFKAGLTPDEKTGHWPDTFKKPNHPTFSNESQYAKDAPEKAGRWEGETFIAPTPVAEKTNRFAKLQELHNRIKTEGETPELLAEREGERVKLQAAYETENRNFITKSLPFRAVESAAKGIKKGNEQLAAEAVAGVAGLLGKDELRDSLRGVSKRVTADMASEEFIQGELDKESYAGKTLAGWTRQATQAVGEAYLAGGGRAGLSRMAGYYAATSAAEQSAHGKSFTEAAVHGLIEGTFTLAGGKLLGSGTGELAGTGRKTFSDSAANKIATYLAKRTSSKIGKSLAVISGSAGAEVLEEVGTEAAHYMASVGFGEKFNVKELGNRLLNAAGPAALAGGGAKSLHGAINGFSADLAKLRADVKKLPNSPNADKIAAQAEQTIADPPEVDESTTNLSDPPADTVRQDASDQQSAPVVTEGPIQTPAVTTSARQTDVDRDREMLGLDEIDSPETRTWKTALDIATQNGTPRRAFDLANSVLEKPRAFSDVETAGVVVRAVELKNQHAELTRQLKDVSDPADIASRSGELNRLESEFGTITQALRTSGTEKGRALAAQKLTINADYDLVSVLTRAKASKGDALTPEQRQNLEGLTEKSQQAEKRVKSFDGRQQKREHEKTHREVLRLRGAVTQIRQGLGLEEASEKSADVPGISDSDKADIAELDAKLKAAEAALDKLDAVKPGERIHNRPSEKEVSDLDDAITRVRANLKRKTPKPGQDSQGVELKKIEALQKKLTEAQETLRKAKAGESTTKAVNRRADVMSQQRDKLHYELDKTRRDIRQAIVSAKPKNLWHHASTLTDLSRGLITSMDYSALGRQAKFAAWAHPVVAAKNFMPMVKAGWSDQHAYKIEQEILARPNAHLYDLGMTIHRQDSELSDREETFVTKLLEKPIHIKAFGQQVKLWNPVGGSQRAYIAFINRMRADVFDLLAKTHGGDMGMTRAEYKQLGHLINVNTGRGGFGTADQHMRTASLVMFAPRFALSRIQYAIGEPGWHSSNRVRKIVAKEYARTFIGAAAWYGLYAAAWGDDERFSLTFDPRSPDFGKIVLGNTRLDPLGGMAQWGRFAARMITGQTVQDGKVKDMSPYDKWQETSRFARSKASPILGQGLNLLTGEDVMHNPVDLTSVEGATNLGLGLVIPLSIRDIRKAMEDQGIPRGTVLSILNTFGEGIQVYESKR